MTDPVAGDRRARGVPMHGMKRNLDLRRFTWAIAAVAGVLLAQPVGAQYVDVTLRLDTNQVRVGETTTLRVYAQVAASQRAAADRIFSWYVDLLNSAGTIAAADYARMAKAGADQDPRTSSAGRTDGANQRGVYDTFLNLPGAGVAQPVELFSVPVTGLAAGQAVFRVQAGTGVPNLAADFIVAPKTGTDPWIGGNYGTALATLQVSQSTACSIRLNAVRERLPGGQTKMTLTFTPCPGRTHVVQYRDQLGSGVWQALPGGPHNSGSVVDTSAASQRFYRVRAD